MTDAEAPFDFLHERWFWISAAVLAALVVGLTVAYYAKHPERDLFADFSRRGVVDIPSTNGHVPYSEATVGAETDRGQTAG